MSKSMLSLEGVVKRAPINPPRRRGQPSVYGDDKLVSVNLIVRVTPELKTAFDELCRGRGVTSSIGVRRLLEWALAQKRIP